MLRTQREIESFAQAASPQFSLGIELGRSAVSYTAQFLAPDALRDQAGPLVHKSTLAAESIMANITPGLGALTTARLGVELGVNEAIASVEQRQTA